MVKVLASLVTSMTIGAVVLLALEKRPLPAGAFSLASYSRLNPIEQITGAHAASWGGRWNRIEVFYSGTAAGNIQQLASLRGLEQAGDVNFHFLVCNGRGGEDGQIQVGERWRKQWSCVPGGIWYGGGKTIRICVVANGDSVLPSDCQNKRTGELVEWLSRRFGVVSEQIVYPEGWQL